MASVPVGDIITVCTIIIKTLSHCVTASREKRAHCDVLTRIQDKISLFMTRMDQYILYEDQKKAWYGELTSCQHQIFKLRKILDHNHKNDDDDDKNIDPSIDNSKSAKKNLNFLASSLENINYAVFRRQRVDKQIKDLDAKVKELRFLDDLILREAIKKSAPMSLRLPEKTKDEAQE